MLLLAITLMTGETLIPGYILFPPNNRPGEIRVEQLGWKKPFIIVRPVDTIDQWIVIDTITHQLYDYIRCAAHH
jgi:hypothetical protein